MSSLSPKQHREATSLPLGITAASQQRNTNHRTPVCGSVGGAMPSMKGAAFTPVSVRVVVGMCACVCVRASCKSLKYPQWKCTQPEYILNSFNDRGNLTTVYFKSPAPLSELLSIQINSYTLHQGHSIAPVTFTHGLIRSSFPYSQ